jgi:hypothetical protein
MAKTIIYNADGSVFSSTDTAGPGLVYNRLDIGVLLLNQAFPTGPNVYDFRVPGDSNNNTFKYRFPRDGYLLGVSMTGTLSTSITGGNYVSKTDGSTGTTADVMQPADAGNGQTYVPATFAQKGVLIMAPTPIAFKKDDLASMKFYSASAVTVSLSGFLLVGLAPQ